ncbi:ATP-binding protein [Sorangium sp. So ce861]|uniref:ATP-binding protein n=1 Tax=Sorangium sp. So ce861 TaxID=3133323 RepID=UPI003F5F1204
MSKKAVRAALALARAGDLEAALVVLRGVDRGFIRKRLAHYKAQPDHREAALQIEAALERARASVAELVRAPSPAAFEAPLPPATAAAPASPITFDDPVPFLTWASADWDHVPEFRLDDLSYTDIWPLVALSCLLFPERNRRPRVDLGGESSAARFAHAIGRRTKPMIELAVADAGIGIPRHLRRSHPHLVDYRQALERALLPHISGTFEEGLTGSFENAGLGLYMISELARQTQGRLLIATTGAALVLQAGEAGKNIGPRFLDPPGIGFPGTLVAFEIPSGAVQNYHAVMQAILNKAKERTPKRASGRWISFSAAPEGAHRVRVFEAREDTLAASRLSVDEIRPRILSNASVELDFDGLDLCTQSWLHALLFEPVRLAWALRVPIHVVGAKPAVQEGLRFLESYALGG